MDVGKLFKLPSLPASALNKRKWGAPSADELRQATTSVVDVAEAPAGDKRTRVEDEDEDEDEAQAEYAVAEDDGVEDDEGGRFFGGGLTAEQQQILEIMNRGEAQGAEESSASGVVASARKQLLQLEKAINTNQEMRLKYPDDPQRYVYGGCAHTRFIASEADLDAELRALGTLATDPVQQYGEFVKLGSAVSVVGLLSHENVDIASAAIEVLEELTDDDVLDGAGRDGARGPADAAAGQAALQSVAEALCAEQLPDLVVSNLTRFRDAAPGAELSAEERANIESDQQGIFHSLGLLENLVSLRPPLADQLVARTALLPWLLARVQPATRPVDQNSAYAAELLAILLQESDANRAAFGRANGTDAVLRALAPFRHVDPGDDTEFVENLFDALCSSLLHDANKRRFLDCEGVELMVLFLRERRAARLRALRVLDHALSGVAGAPQCERFVQVLGLKSLFPVLMMPLESGARARRGVAGIGAQDMEHVLGILASLLHSLPSESAARLRLMAKFVEQEYKKTDRLLELRAALVDRVAAAPALGAGLRDSVPVADAAELQYLARLESGLFSLQLVDYILAWLIMEDDGILAHVHRILQRQGQTLDALVAVLREYRENVGEDALVGGGMAAAGGGERQGEEEGGAEDADAQLRLRDVLDALLAYLESVRGGSDGGHA
ncbi:hypothetical protein MSPP1_003339 [Malassezia sp. CBS 17886]|nr:hypothetical protein MSPP1_003339 [Malassezia sp. CBS 17886]